MGEAEARKVLAVIAGHRAELDKPGVLGVRPGYEVTNGWLTGRPAIVVTVAEKTADPARPDSLPESVDGIPVDVRQASPVKKQALLDPDGYARSGRITPDRGGVPLFATEVAPTGAALTVPPPEHVLAAAHLKPNLPYTPPAGVSLDPVTDQVTVHLAASPDAGWPVLKAFLSGVENHLTVGLYDWTSRHVLDTVTTALAGKELALLLDHPARNPTADQTDEQTIADLVVALGAGLSHGWALDRFDPLATAWIYPTAYHIKVAVRDHTAFWLSSGNWNNSNQPDIDPVANPAAAAAARKADRDWHVILEHPGLAQTFEAYLTNDLTIAQAHNTTPGQAATDDPDTPTTVEAVASPGGGSAAGSVTLAPQLDAVAAGPASTPVFEEFFGPTTITDRIQVTPLLTPDPGVYVDAVTALIAGAQTSLYMQFQYIELPKTPGPDSEPFSRLVQAVVDRQNAGVDVKVIMSQYQTAGYLEQLQAAGLDVVHNVKLQNGVHNKGIVVDQSAVLVSSQNWSTAGTLFNRDAGLILHHPDAAAYFQRIFLHDWTHLAAQHALDD